MDGGKSGRAFPGHTTKELKASLASKSDMEPGLRQRVEAEVAARESGASQAYVVPQTNR